MTRPKMPQHQAAAPAATHRKIATCEEVDCPRFLSGFDLILPDPPPDIPASHPRCATPQDAALCGYCVHHERLRYIRSGDSGREFREHHDQEGMVRFRFPPGTQCFQPHTAPNGREAIYLINDQKVRGRDWTDSLGESLDKHGLLSRKGG